LATAEAPRHSQHSVLRFLAQRKDLLQGVVITGGEPSLQADLKQFLVKVKRLDLAVKLDTNGSRPEVLADLLDASLVDYAAMDVKAPRPKYDLLCGVSVDHDAIYRALDLIAASGIPHHFRTTLFPPLLTPADLITLQMQLPRQSEYVVQRFQKQP
jgi:pyruvate formate lyase activating enzyme